MIMWKVKYKDMITTSWPTLAEAITYAKDFGQFVIITDGTTEIVGAFGVDDIKNKKLPDGTSYEWTMRRDENKSWRKKNV